MEALGLLAEGAPLADWRLQVDGEDVAPAQLEAALTQAQEETPTEEEPAAEAETPAQEEPAEAEGGVLATLARALGLAGGEEPAEPAVTVDGAPADADALLDVIAFLDRYDLLTERGARTDWAMTVPGKARQVTQAELKELLEAGTLDEDAVVTVGGQSITAGDLLVVLDIEAELRRIQETYFPEGGVDLSVEEAEALYSLYSQLLANGGFTLYNTNAADDLTAADFLSGIDQTVTISASGVDNAQMNSAYTVTVTLNEAQPNEDVIFSWRTFSGSVNAGGSGTVIIPAGQTEATFTVNVGSAADRLDDGGQGGAFVVQVYDVKNALFADGKDSWTKAVRVQGKDALKYYEEQSATASKTDSNGIVAAADHSSTRNWLKGNATTGQILTGTTDPFLRIPLTIGTKMGCQIRTTLFWSTPLRWRGCPPERTPSPLNTMLRRQLSPKMQGISLAR